MIKKNQLTVSSITQSNPFSYQIKHGGRHEYKRVEVLVALDEGVAAAVIPCHAADDFEREKA